MKYFKLTDHQNRGTIVRAEGRSFQQFFPGRGWLESGIMMLYFNDDSPVYDAYVEISEEEALRLTA